jgi:hypothetical protein
MERVLATCAPQTVFPMKLPDPSAPTETDSTDADLQSLRRQPPRRPVRCTTRRRAPDLQTPTPTLGPTEQPTTD